MVRELTLRVSGGEVVGLTGLAGSGYDEVPYLLFGARRARAGRLRLGRSYDLTAMTPARAIRAGIGLLPAGRERDGAVGSLTVADNLMLPRLARYSRRYGLGLDGRRLAADARSLLLAHGVAPAGPASAASPRSAAETSRGRWSRSGSASSPPCCCSTSHCEVWT